MLVEGGQAMWELLNYGSFCSHDQNPGWLFIEAFVSGISIYTHKEPERKALVIPFPIEAATVKELQGEDTCKTADPENGRLTTASADRIGVAGKGQNDW